MIEAVGLPAPQITRKTGAEPFRCGDILLNRTLLDFWRWSSSDLVSNTLRGVLAEYIVACALDIPYNQRVEWDAFDLKTQNGLNIEVKSAAYLQSWQQKALSQITFGIQPTCAWEAATNDYTGELRRQAHLYVFCLLHHQDKASLDPLDMNQWTFFLLASSALDEKLPAQKTIRLASLLKMNPFQHTYQELAQAITEGKWRNDTDTQPGN
ncbi:MAG: hypothetical protein ACRYFS_02880 [Janthinobacterium lividum]